MKKERARLRNIFVITMFLNGKIGQILGNENRLGEPVEPEVTYHEE